MSSDERDEGTTSGRRSANGGLWRGPGAAVPGAAGPSRLDTPGHNCQRGETRAVDAGRPRTRGAPVDRLGLGVVRAAASGDLDWWRSVLSPASLEVVDWWDALERVWREKRRPHVRRLLARVDDLDEKRVELDAESDDAEGRGEPSVLARAAARKLVLKRMQAEGRAQSQASPRAARLVSCKTRWIVFGCACQKVERPVGCDVTLLCDWCRRRHLRKWRRRITKALGAQSRAKHRAWKKNGHHRGREPLVYLLTLTIGHSGDVAQDRADLWAGWRAFQKWLCRATSASVRVRYHSEVIDGVRRRVPHSVVVPEAFHYAAVWEVTKGDDGAGHVHCHIAAVLPYFDWSDANAAWRAACPRSDNVDFRRTKAEGAAKYLAKYVTKGVQVAEMPGDLAGSILASWYGKRRVSTSRAFWRPLDARGKACCRRCTTEWEVLERPKRIARAAPEAAWFALVELHRVTLWRGPPQASLRFGLRVDVAQAARRRVRRERPGSH